jgi:hypothetical protein
MILQEEAFGAKGMHRDLVYTLPELGVFAGHKHNADTAILRRPGSASIVSAVNTTG